MDEQGDGRQVGERLRAIRRQKGLSLHDVEARSGQEFKASVLGAYERGERAISVPRLLRLAELYRVPPDQLLPRSLGDPDIDLTEPVTSSALSPGDGFTIDLVRLHEIEDDDAAVVARYAATIQLQRQDFNGQMLTIRNDDLRVLAAVMGRSPDELGGRLAELGLARRRPLTAEHRAREQAPTPRGPATATLVPTCRLRHRPRSRSSYRATTSWWACWVSATNCCASSRTRSRSRSTCAATRSPSPAPEDEAERVGRLFEELVTLLESGHVIDPEGLGRSIQMLKADQRPSEILTTEVLRGRKPVRPKTAGQKRYVDAVRTHTVTFGIGPAGTGKSYLAVALAVQALQAKQIHRIILTRPAVEAGERLGFLPGDILAKVDPYLRPLYDALYDMLEPEVVSRLMERGTIEVAPLAFMRGRTLNDSFIILDEAQNTTAEQMKMFLTRLGFGSKIVVTGDVTQIDLPDGRGRSGLLAVRDILDGIPDLAFVELDSHDVVRHKIVQDIVNAYAKNEAQVSRVGVRVRRAERRRGRPRTLAGPGPHGAGRGAGARRRRGVADLRRRDRDHRPQPAVPRRHRAHRRAVVPDRRRPRARRPPARLRRTGPGRAGRARRPTGGAGRRRAVPARSRSVRRPPTPAPSTTSSRSSSSTGCCT